MKKTEIKNRFTGDVIFTYDGEKLRYSDLSNADLRYSDLRNADLRNADLRYANLINADLRYADLRYSDLSNADLSNADLRNADLSNAYLSNADLSNAYLSNAYLSNANLINADLRYADKVPMYCKWSHGITNKNLIHIGCEKRTIEEWDVFFASDEVISTQRDTQEFKQIQAVYEAYKAYLTILSK